METDKALIKYLEKLSKIELAPEQRETVTKDLEEIISYTAMLSELDTDGVSNQAEYGENQLREDKVLASTNYSSILKNAPETKDGFFVVPKAVE